MDPGDIGLVPKGKPTIWAAVYVVEEGGVSSAEMLFTVATDSEAAEESFLEELARKYLSVSDLAPEQIVQIPLVGSSEPVNASVASLERLGYRFAMPLREQIPAEHVGELVYALLSFSETARDE